MNANPSETTGISPFFATNGYEPRMTFDLQPTIEEAALTATPSQAKERKRVEQLAQEIKKRSEFLQEQIALAQSQMEQHSNAHRQPSPNYQPQDKVWLSMRNIKT
jgi:hypothetical protein